MTVIELKEKLIAQIKDTDNEEILDHISDLFEYVYKPEDIHMMSPGEIEAVEEGLAQLDRGEFLTNEEVNKLTDKCLGRYMVTTSIKGKNRNFRILAK